MGGSARPQGEEGAEQDEQPDGVEDDLLERAFHGGGDAVQAGDGGKRGGRGGVGERVFEAGHVAAHLVGV